MKNIFLKLLAGKKYKTQFRKLVREKMAPKMRAEIMEVLIIFCLVLISWCDAVSLASGEESRGKKKKIGLLGEFHILISHRDLPSNKILYLIMHNIMITIILKQNVKFEGFFDS